MLKSFYQPTMKRETFSTFVPFTGFYYSIHNDIIDGEEERLFHDVNGDPYSNLLEIFFDHINYRNAYKEYAKLYVDVAKQITGLDSLQFEEMTSPREYNFQTDRIFASLSRSDLVKMLKAVRGEKLNKKIEEMYSSRSGFISFYPNHVSAWPRVEEWDHNHVGAVFSAYLELEHPGLEDKAAEEIYSDGSVSDILYQAADYTGKSAVDVASIKYRLEEDKGVICRFPNRPCETVGG
jgi:hypothetical protein